MRPTKKADKDSRLALKALRELGGQVNHTCGLHVHHSIAHLGPRDVATAIAGYRQSKKALQLIIPASRWNNGYCKWDENYGTLSRSKLDEWKDQSGWRRVREVLYADRYSVTNLCALFDHGTLEFRQHSGTLDGDKVMNWVLLTQGFVNLHERVKSGVIADPLEPCNQFLGPRDVAELAEYVGLPVIRPFYEERAKQLNRAGDPEDYSGEPCDCDECNENAFYCESCGDRADDDYCGDCYCCYDCCECERG